MGREAKWSLANESQQSTAARFLKLSRNAAGRRSSNGSSSRLDHRVFLGYISVIYCIKCRTERDRERQSARHFVWQRRQQRNKENIHKKYQFQSIFSSLLSKLTIFIAVIASLIFFYGNVARIFKTPYTFYYVRCFG